ncbi:Sm-like ribonucleoprotein [Zopfochytrium polystomum]|nr:Sm-like ribonucleoprotein [Zopfochytrium polystomum]
MDIDTFVPGSANLVDLVDKKLLVILRDGRKLVGWLRSYDQFANLVLQDTVERYHLGTTFGEDYRGIFVIRGENVVLVGEVDETKESKLLSSMTEVSGSQISAITKDQLDERIRKDKIRNRVLHERGFSVDAFEHDRY